MKAIKKNCKSIFIIISYLIMTVFISSCGKEPVKPKETPKDTTIRIDSLSSTSLHYGDTLTIFGINFSNSVDENKIMINGVIAPIVSVTTTTLRVIVPAVGNTHGFLNIQSGSQSILGGNINYTPDIFVSGTQNTGAFEIATYWKNGNPVTLSTNQSFLSSIYIDGSDVYGAGYERINNIKLAKYWKNGIKTTVGVNESAVNSITVNGNNVYLGGWEIINGFDLPRIWKNGIGTSINFTDPLVSQVVLGNGACNGIYSSGSNVYATGSARLQAWECTNVVTPATLVPNNNKQCFAYAVFVNEKDKYIGGHINNATTGLAMATVWKNGVATPLTSGQVSVAVVSALFVAGSDVYAAGYEQEDYYHGGATFAKYWKNGVAVKLSNVASKATGIAVFGDDVYVSGWESTSTGNVAKYWKNGTSIKLGKDILSSEASAIIVR